MNIFSLLFILVLLLRVRAMDDAHAVPWSFCSSLGENGRWLNESMLILRVPVPLAQGDWLPLSLLGFLRERHPMLRIEVEERIELLGIHDYKADYYAKRNRLARPIKLPVVAYSLVVSRRAAGPIGECIEPEVGVGDWNWAPVACVRYHRWNTLTQVRCPSGTFYANLGTFDDPADNYDHMFLHREHDYLEPSNVMQFSYDV